MPPALLALFVGASLGLSGWAGGLLAVTAGLLVSRSTSPERGLMLLAGSLLWLLASGATGNRTLFFPFACWLAAAVFVRNSPTAYWKAVFYSATVMVLFFSIRVQQGASGKVLWMEFVAAITLAGVAVVSEGLLPSLPFRGWVVALLVSLLAGLSVIV
ncbi:MAG TPA: hypothetical protein DDY91_15895 [Planctomycetaceae bacterium]|nr:hypothetical protein [Planctomycetaceae bacterium]